MVKLYIAECRSIFITNTYYYLQNSNHTLADFKQQVEVAATERHETGKEDRNQMSQVYEEPIRTRCVCNIDSTDMYYNTVAAQSSSRFDAIPLYSRKLHNISIKITSLLTT